MRSARRPVAGWDLYLILTVVLAPVLIPMGPAQTAIIDLVNAIAIAIFLPKMITGGRAMWIPLILPAFLITVGSLIAVFNAVAPGASWLTLAQDAYLFVWFIVLVNVMRGRQELTKPRIAWVVVADVVAILGIVMVMIQAHASLGGLVGPKGLRATSTFTNTNELASYLVLSLFVLLSLDRKVSPLFQWGSIGMLGMGLLATKSNAGMLSLAAGLAVWAPLRAWTRHRSPLKLAAGALLAVAAVMAIWWLSAGWGVGSAQLRRFEAQSSLARAGHSSEERSVIWGKLLTRYAKSPLGIGPGNSKWQPLSVSERERKQSYFSKEAHNDGLAYLIERGPLGLLGLLIALAQVIVMLTIWLRQSRENGSPEDSGAVPAALAGAMVAWLFFSFTHETLHSRHYWVFLAMICALAARRGHAHKPARLESVGQHAGRPNYAAVGSSRKAGT